MSFEERLQGFARQRAQLRMILNTAPRALDMAQLYAQFLIRFGYLPDLERRMRELVDAGEVQKIRGPVPRYELVREVIDVGDGSL